MNQQAAVGTYKYPVSKEVRVTRHEYALLLQLFRQLTVERLVGATLGATEVLTAIEETDSTLSKLSAIFMA